MKKRLAIITTHPIQYNAPLFSLLNERGNIEIMVFYTWGEDVLEDKYDPGFGKTIKWDIPLLHGYPYTFVKNVSRKPGSKRFKGIDNPILIKELEAWEPDAVLIYGWSFKSHLRVMRHFKGKIPVIFRGDSTLLDQFGFAKHWARKIFLTWVYRYIDYALYVGKSNWAYFLAHGLPPHKLIRAPHTVDNNRFNKNEENVARAGEIKKSLGITDDMIVFLFAAKFEPKKDPVQLIKAFKQVKHPGKHLIMVGDGPLKEEMEKERGDDHTIHFLPFQNQSQMPVTYQLGDVFVLPSLGPETWGLAVNEAMAGELAIVVSDTCGCAEDLIKVGINGYVFRSGNLESLVEKLQLFADNSGALKEMGKASKEIISDYNFEMVCLAIEQLMVKV